MMNKMKILLVLISMMISSVSCASGYYRDYPGYYGYPPGYYVRPHPVYYPYPSPCPEWYLRTYGGCGPMAYYNGGPYYAPPPPPIVPFYFNFGIIVR